MPNTADWRVIPLTVDDVVNGKHAQIQTQYEQIFFAAGCPPLTALFSTRPFHDPPEAFMEIYFSPKAAKVAAVIVNGWKAKVAQQPPKDPNITSLLVGVHGDWDALL